jgi:cytochrome c oxidase assembly protein subunit 15
MAETTFQQFRNPFARLRRSAAPSPEPAHPTAARDRVRWLAFRLAFGTWLLMAVGSATRVANAGLACPDWPLCYGQALPWTQMNLQVFLEWFHRLDAGLLGLGTLGMVAVALLQRRSLPRWVPPVTVLALVLIVAQATLGALTVTELLRFDIVTAHLGMALLFFCTLLALGTALLPHRGMGSAGALRWLGGASAIAIYGQSIAGGLVGSRWALHQCLDLAQRCGTVQGHLLGVVPAVVVPAALLGRAWRTPALHPWLRRLRWAIAGLLGLQLLLGYGTFRLHLQIEPLTVLHQAIGAALLGSLVVFTVLACRDGQTGQQMGQQNAAIADPMS